jgi:hypothetical protein
MSRDAALVKYSLLRFLRSMLEGDDGERMKRREVGMRRGRAARCFIDRLSSFGPGEISYACPIPTFLEYVFGLLFSSTVRF